MRPSVYIYKRKQGELAEIAVFNSLDQENGSLFEDYRVLLMDPYLRTLDNFATAAFYELAIRRTPACSPNSPQWFNPAPQDTGYPWTQIRVPEVPNPSVSAPLRTEANKYSVHLTI